MTDNKVIVTHGEASAFITQVFFEGDPYLRWDPWAKDSLVVKLVAQGHLRNGRSKYVARFDIVLPDAS